MRESDGRLTDPSGANALTRQIIGCAIRVHKELGPGLLESAYSRCLMVELRAAGLSARRGMPLSLTYRGLDLGPVYFVDILVNDIVVLEIKSVSALLSVHTAQLITYLRLMQKPVGLLINFNVPVLTNGIKRVVNSR